MSSALVLALGVGLYVSRAPRAEVVDEGNALGRVGPVYLRATPTPEGVAFYGSATFDTELRPGVITGDGQDSVRDWEGYAYAGEFAVYASDSDRGVVRDILRSAK